MEQPPYLAPGYIGKVALRNRLIRAATSETMCTTDGEVTDELIALYSNLAKGGAGLLITGHIYIEPAASVPTVRSEFILTDSFRGFGGSPTPSINSAGRSSLRLSAGSQSGMPGIEPVAPSETRNDIFGTRARELTTNEIDGIIWAFDAAAHRAVASGFDGIHIHGGNGYLIAQFSSPYTNRRIDKWGIGPQGRDRFFVAVYSAIRDAVGNDFPISARFGVADSIAGGLDEQEGIARAVLLRARNRCHRS